MGVDGMSDADIFDEYFDDEYSDNVSKDNENKLCAKARSCKLSIKIENGQWNGSNDEDFDEPVTELD